MVGLIGSISSGVPQALVELTTLGRTLAKRAEDVLAPFDRPGTSNCPAEPINGRHEHLRGSALGFRNLTRYIARSLLESGGIPTPTTPWIVKSPIRSLRRSSAVAVTSPADRRARDRRVGVVRIWRSQ